MCVSFQLYVQLVVPIQLVISYYYITVNAYELYVLWVNFPLRVNVKMFISRTKAVMFVSILNLSPIEKNCLQSKAIENDAWLTTFERKSYWDNLIEIRIQ